MHHGNSQLQIVGSGGSWRVKHDGEPIGRACYERQKKHANNTSTISIFATSLAVGGVSSGLDHLH